MSTKKAVKECSPAKALPKPEVAYLPICELVFSSGIRFEGGLVNLRLVLMSCSCMHLNLRLKFIYIRGIGVVEPCFFGFRFHAACTKPEVETPADTCHTRQQVHALEHEVKVVLPLLLLFFVWYANP
jgi:hypothetical protein